MVGFGNISLLSDNEIKKLCLSQKPIAQEVKLLMLFKNCPRLHKKMISNKNQ